MTIPSKFNPPLFGSLIFLTLALWVYHLSIPVQTYGVLYLKKGKEAEQARRHDGAIKYYERSIFHDPKAVAGYLHLALIYGKENNPSLKFKFLNEAVKQGPDWKKINHELQSSDVIKDPVFAQACYELGIYYKELNDLNRAENYFKMAVTFDGGNNDFVYELGQAYVRSNKKDLAIDQLNRLLGQGAFSLSKKLHQQIYPNGPG